MQGLCVIGNFIPIIQNAPRGCAHFILYRNENQEIKGIIARMKRIKKQAVLESITLLENANEYVTADLQTEELMNILTQCQEAAILTGNDLETQGDSTKELVTMLEEYCELIFQVSQSMDDPESRKQLAQTVRNLLLRLHSKTVELLPEDRKEIVFLPYKASMWDSLESVWKAADADPECDAYVIPIPYYDKNPDGSFREMHYEGDLFPDYVPVIKYDAYDFGQRRPDAVFIHNPYDGANFVTSVHPFFYSDNLKKYTDCLVYIPYFASAGGMSEGQALCPAYIYADYIVIQSEKYIKFYDKSIPKRKFLVLGSPKFDSVIEKCQNPPEIPKEWREKMLLPDGSKKRVFFYNTSIGGMLSDTGRFLKKMEYVFNCFAGKEDVCLLWRPHPLLESTFVSMRASYKPVYDTLKHRFITENIGIYDKTPCMEDTIALSDVYIGDSATSVTSFFGIAGKPLFLFDNTIHTLPMEDSWKYWITHAIRGDQNQYSIIHGNKLFYAPNNDMYFHYLCDLPIQYAGTDYYQRAFAYKGKVFMIPLHAQDILVMDSRQNFHKIQLRREIEKAGAFGGFSYHVNDPRYLFIFPQQYPAMIRLDLDTEEVAYINGVRDYNSTEVDGQKVWAAKWQIDDQVYILNAAGTEIAMIDIHTLEIRIQKVSFNRLLTGIAMEKMDDEILWLIPQEGTVVTRWNRITGETREYDVMIDGLEATDRQHKIPTVKWMLGSFAFYQGKVIIAPNLANKFIELDPESGKVKEWEAPFVAESADQDDYCVNYGVGYFIREVDDWDKFSFYSAPVRKAYWIDLGTKEIRERNVHFDKEEVRKHDPGFSRRSQWMQYGCQEDVFNTLSGMIDGKIAGGQYDKQKQIQSFQEINASPAGDCGKKVYAYIINR